jgi:hypothetical protein
MDSFSPFLIGFLIGVIATLIAMSYRSDSAAVPPVSSGDMSEIIAQQIKHHQSQNILRQMQLEQARQEAEFRQLEENRVKYLSAAQTPSYLAIESAVKAELERRGLTHVV